MLMERLIKKLTPGVHIIEAVNGADACDKFVRSHPDLIIMDIQMPGMSGIEAVMEIRAIEERNRTNRTPIIALTAADNASDSRDCLNAGMDEVLIKPASKPKLERLLKKYLQFSTPDGNIVPLRRVNSLPHFDREALMSFLDFDTQLMEILIESLDENFQNTIDALNNAVQTGNRESIEFHAHSIKGTARNLCFEQMQDLAWRLESGTDLSDDQINHLRDSILHEWKIIRGILQLDVRQVAG